MRYLLFLQDLRHSCPDFINYFMIIVSGLVNIIAPLITLVLFLSVNKKKAARVLFNVIGSNFAMNSLKVTFCIYRPWIRYPQLEKALDIDGVPTGYSFPSGHTTMGTTFYGSLAIWNKKKKWLFRFFLFMILLTAFARNWIGAHTLQDVLCAMVLGFASMSVNYLIYRWLEEDTSRDIWILIFTLAVCFAAALYFSFKSYPMDYDSAGELIVDPVIMSRDAWQSLGMLSAWVISWFIERRYIRFEEGGTVKRRFLRGFTGCLIFSLLYIVIMPIATYSMNPSLGGFLRLFVPVFATACGYTCLVKIVQNRIALKEVRQ